MSPITEIRRFALPLRCGAPDLLDSLCQPAIAGGRPGAAKAKSPGGKEWG